MKGRPTFCEVLYWDLGTLKWAYSSVGKGGNNFGGEGPGKLVLMRERWVSITAENAFS